MSTAQDAFFIRLTHYVERETGHLPVGLRREVVNILADHATPASFAGAERVAAHGHPDVAAAIGRIARLTGTGTAPASATAPRTAPPRPMLRGHTAEQLDAMSAEQRRQVIMTAATNGLQRRPCGLVERVL